MEALDMPLDSLVKKSKAARGGATRAARRNNTRGGGTGRGAGRAQNNRATLIGNYLAPRSSLFRKNSRFRGSFGINKPSRGAAAAGALWQQSLIDEGARLFVSNLDNGVSNEDIKELFSEVGDLKYCSVHYDKMGRSKGTAEVYFERRDNAMMAMKRYNNVQLDGKPMVIDVIGGTQITNIVPAPVLRSAFANLAGRNHMPAAGIRRAPREARVPPRGGAETRGRGGGRGRGRGRGRGGGRGAAANAAPHKTVDELNAELDKYHNQAMDTAA